MTVTEKPAPEAIRRARADNPKMREREVWAVRKPTRDGHVTSLEAYDANNDMIVQFFGKRHEGQGERGDWRMIAENLPRVPRSTAA